MVELLGYDGTNVVAVWRYECILTENEKASPTTPAKLFNYSHKLQMELAVAVDVGFISSRLHTILKEMAC